MKPARASAALTNGSWISVDEHARVLGIDPGTRIAGYAVLDFDRRGDQTILDAGVLRLTETAPLQQRLRQLHDDLDALLSEHRPTHLVLEAVFSNAKFVTSAITLAHARGVVMLVAELRGIPILELPPAEVKKAVTGNGRATKLQVQSAVVSQCGLATLTAPADVSDAIAIALCGGRRLRGLA